MFQLGNILGGQLIVASQGGADEAQDEGKGGERICASGWCLVVSFPLRAQTELDQPANCLAEAFVFTRGLVIIAINKAAGSKFMAGGVFELGPAIPQ